MTNDSDLFLCLKLADKSYYPLYQPGEKGDKQLVLTPAHQGQEKSEISLYNCSKGRNLLLRDILIENQGDMRMIFSLSGGYLSYDIESSAGVRVTGGLIELAEDEMDIYKGEGGTSKPLLREKRSRSNRILLILSVLITLSLLLFGSFSLSKTLSQDSPPQLKTSGITPR